MIKAIIFDFGGVLVDWNPRYLYADVFSDTEKMEWFLHEVCSTAWNLEQDRGRSFADGIALLEKQYPAFQKEIRLFWEGWPKMLKEKIAETVTLLPQLKQNYAVYGLTNWSAETFPILMDRFDFVQLFDDIVVSGDEGLVKPDKSIYELLLKRYNLLAQECIFIDDNSDNVKAAEQLGFSAILYKNSDYLMQDLSSLGVKGFQ
ncbi:HAD family hydrolase [Sphingobacterium sp. MYb382]|uniref:HAD family hydrolase n=1 Tax=Sphingobacterium sp. MYb382 TaxID=2745278 RepID=UPI00309AB434